MPRPGPELRLSAKFLLSTTYTRPSFYVYTTVRSKRHKVVSAEVFACMSADLCMSGCHSELLQEGRADCQTMGHSAGCDRVSPGSVAHTSHCSLPAVLECGAAAQSRL